MNQPVLSAKHTYSLLRHQRWSLLNQVTSTFTGGSWNVQSEKGSHGYSGCSCYTMPFFMHSKILIISQVRGAVFIKGHKRKSLLSGSSCSQQVKTSKHPITNRAVRQRWAQVPQGIKIRHPIQVQQFPRRADNGKESYNKYSLPIV